MTIKAFLAGTAAATAICFFAWLSIVTAIDPAKTGIIGFILFYFSLFLWLSGVFLLAGFYLRMAVKSRGSRTSEISYFNASKSASA